MESHSLKNEATYESNFHLKLPFDDVAGPVVSLQVIHCPNNGNEQIFYRRKPGFPFIYEMIGFSKPDCPLIYNYVWWWYLQYSPCTAHMRIIDFCDRSNILIFIVGKYGLNYPKHTNTANSCHQKTISVRTTILARAKRNHILTLDFAHWPVGNYCIFAIIRVSTRVFSLCIVSKYSAWNIQPFSREMRQCHVWQKSTI